MKPLFAMLLMAATIQAQSIADIARKERERQAKVQSTHVVTSTESTKVDEPKPASPASDAENPADAADASAAKPSTELPKPQVPPAADPVQAWNNQLNQLRTTIRTLQDRETDLQLQLSQANNQVYAPVTDPATHDRALALVGQIQQQLATVRQELAEATKTLQSLQLQGPPK